MQQTTKSQKLPWVVAAVLACLCIACPTPALAAEFTVVVSDAVYTGSPVRPAITVTARGKALVAGTDYVKAYRANVNAGTGTVVVTGRGGYTGRTTATFTIHRAPASNLQVTGIDASYDYGGKEVTPNPTVRFGPKQLVAGRDYSVSYRDNDKPGSASLVITGQRNFEGTKTVPFTIRQATPRKTSLANATVSVKSATYTGKKLQPKVTVKVNGKTLKCGSDYKVKYASNTNAGKGKATVTGIGAYMGSKTSSFKIAGRPIAKAHISAIDSQLWTGKQLKPKVKVTYAKKKLKAGRDYAVTYKNNVKTGKATAVIKGKGNYAGIKKTTFRIVNAGDDLARAACCVSYSQPGYYNGGQHIATKLWQRIYPKIRPGSPWIRGCHTAINALVKWSGYDDGYPNFGSGFERSIRARTSKWKVVGKWNGKTSSLQPGDILALKRNGVIGYDGNCHELMYVGYPIAREIYRKYLKGTDADLGAPAKSDVFVSAHGAGGVYASRSQAPSICNGRESLATYKGSGYREGYYIIRPVKGINVSKSKYRNVEKNSRPY